MTNDYSYLFNSLNNSGSSNIFDSINYSDYASIKNGSYGKLVKSYYSKDSTEKTSSKDQITDKLTESKNSTSDTTGLSKMKKESDALKSAAEALTNKELYTSKDGQYDTDKIVSAVKDFASEYNDVLSQSDKVNSTDVSKQVSNLQNMTKVMTNALSKVGVTVGTDGKLSVNEDTLKNANMKDVSAIFSGNQSYAAQIEKYANDVSKAAVNSSSIYSSDGTLTSSLQGLYNDWM